MSNRFVQYKPLGYKPVTLPLELIKETLTERRKLIDVMDEAQDQLALIRATPIPGTGYEREAAEENRDLQNLKETTTRYFQDNPTDLYGQKRLIREVKNNITNRMLTGRLGAINNAYTSYAKQMEELQKDAGKKDGFSHTRINEAAELFKFKHQNLGKFDPTTGRYENATSLQNPAYNYDINEQLDAAIKNTPAMKDYTVHKSRDGFTVINTITGKESKEGLQIVKNLYDRLLGDSKYKEDLSWQAQIWAMRNGINDPEKISQYMQAKSKLDAQAGMGYGYVTEEKPTIDTYTDQGGLALYKHQLDLQTLQAQNQNQWDPSPTTFMMEDVSKPSGFADAFGQAVDALGGWMNVIGNSSPLSTVPGLGLGRAFKMAFNRQAPEKDEKGDIIKAQSAITGISLKDEEQSKRITQWMLSQRQTPVTIIDGATGKPKKFSSHYNVQKLIEEYGSDIFDKKTGKLKTKGVGLLNPSSYNDKFGVGMFLNNNGDLAIIEPAEDINNPKTNKALAYHNYYKETMRDAKGQAMIIEEGPDTNLFNKAQINTAKIPRNTQGYKLIAVKNKFVDRVKVPLYMVQAIVPSGKGFHYVDLSTEPVELPNFGTTLQEIGNMSLEQMFGAQKFKAPTAKNPGIFYTDPTE